MELALAVAVTGVLSSYPVSVRAAAAPGTTATATTATATTTAPLVMAHKGLHYPYSPDPENSVGAIARSAAQDVPVEIDILLSKPDPVYPYGVPFVFHDLTLDRMTKRTGQLSNRTATHLASTCLVTVPDGDVCSPYSIPRLRTVLQTMHAAHVPLDIELKNETLSRGQARTIVKRLEAADVWSWDVLAGFDGPMILAGWTQPLAQIRAVAQRRGDPPLLTEYLTVQPDLTPESTTGSAMEAIYFRNVTKDAVIQLHALGLAVDSFTSNKRAFWDALAAADVDWVITDNVVDYQKWAAGQPAG